MKAKKILRIVMQELLRELKSQQELTRFNVGALNIQVQDLRKEVALLREDIHGRKNLRPVLPASNV